MLGVKSPMSDSRRFAVHYPDVVAEAFDGEYVIVNLTTGTYFSLEGTAAALWPLIISGMSTDEILATLFEETPAHARDEIEAFCDALLSHSLIIAVDTPVTGVAVPDTVTVSYSPPTIGVHSDLEDILLLDPVHDVDEAGWPRARPLT